MTHYARIATPDTLRQGWERVLQNSEMAGADGVSVPMFALRLDRELALLEEELRARTYSPGPLFAFDIPKPSGGTRRLAVPPVRDRVAQSAALVVLQPLVEAELEHSTFAYRPGRSYKDAIERLRFLRDEGYHWVVDADIHSYFDEIDHVLLLERVARITPDPDLVELIRKWISVDMLFRRERIPRQQGVPQGAVISPMLANLYLDDLDEALEKEGFKLVRYADDFVVLCKRRERADVALDLTEELLEDLELRLNKEKTRVVSFDEGFRFLGSLFVRSLIVPAKNPGKTTDAVPVAPSVSVVPTDPPPPATPHRDVSTPVYDRERLEETALGRAFLRALDTEGVTIAEFVDRMTDNPALSTPSLETPRRGVSIPFEESDPNEESTASTEPSVSTDGARLHRGTSTGVSPSSAAAFRRTLYIQEQGAWLRMNAGRFHVTDGKQKHATLLDLPAIKVDQIIVFGRCLITPAAIQYCLRKQIPITLLSAQGQYFGQIDATTAAQVNRQRLQFLHHLDAPARLTIARRIVDAKLYNLRSMLRRYARRLNDAALADAAGRIAQTQRRLTGAETLDQLRGYEGSGSAAYFSVFGRTIAGSGFIFEGRNRQPPRDPVNAMLSFGYTLLYYNIYAMARVHRLNPYVGARSTTKKPATRRS